MSLQASSASGARIRRRFGWLCGALAIAAAVCGATGTAAAAPKITVDAGALQRAVIQQKPWSLKFVDRTGASVLTEAAAGQPGSAAGAIGFNAGFATRAPARAT